MEKRNKIIYWVVTVFLSVGMLAGGIQQTLQIGGYNEIITKLHYPLYVLSILGVWKILGVIAILIPKFPLLKEWAYAGFGITFISAAIAHINSNDTTAMIITPLVMLAILIVSNIYLHKQGKTVVS